MDIAATGDPPDFSARAPARTGDGACRICSVRPIRAPARAQDLILRHRVTDYRAGGRPADMFGNPQTDRLKLFLSQILRGH
jgi:hypothetical protein